MNLPIQLHSPIPYSIPTDSANITILQTQLNSKLNDGNLNNDEKNEEMEDLSVSDDTDSSVIRGFTSETPISAILRGESSSMEEDQCQPLPSLPSPTKSDVNSFIFPEEKNPSKLAGNEQLLEAGRRKKVANEKRTKNARNARETRSKSLQNNDDEPDKAEIERRECIELLSEIEILFAQYRE
ncbi:hypothetical protein HK096_003509, partial [Nowakowskiella sp. JEL0078]